MRTLAGLLVPEIGQIYSKTDSRGTVKIKVISFTDKRVYFQSMSNKAVKGLSMDANVWACYTKVE